MDRLAGRENGGGMNIDLGQLKRLAEAVLADGATVSDPSIDDAFQDAANPQTVLELIDEIARLQNRVKQLKERLGDDDWN